MSLALLGTLDNRVLRLYPALTIPELNGKRLREEILPETLTVDAGMLQQADSAGVAALVWLAALAGRQGRALTWQNLPPSLQELLNLYEIDLQGMNLACMKN